MLGGTLNLRRPLGLVLIVCCIVAAAFAPVFARAAAAVPQQDDAAKITAAEPAAASEGEGHGWAIVRTGPDERPALLHIPPRSGANPSSRGTVRFAAWLNEEPAGVGAWGSRVYLAFKPEARGDAGLMRHVVTMGVNPLVAGLWEQHPAGRFRTLAALPGEGELVGFVGLPSGAAALIRTEADGGNAAGWRLLVLDRSHRWAEAALPWEGDDGKATAPGEGDRVHLVGLTEGPGLVVERGAGGMGEIGKVGEFWTATIAEEARGVVTAEWGMQVLNMEGVEGAGEGRILALDGQLLRYRHVEGSGLVLQLIRPGTGGGVFEIAAFADVPPPPEGRVIAMHGAGTLAMLWPGVEKTPGVGRGYELREVSAFSGRVWYEGAGSSGGIVATRQFQILAVFLVLVMGAVLLFILRPGEVTSVLPAGVAPAEPSRRISAAAADFLLGVMLASALTGRSGSEILSPVVLLGSAEVAGAFVLALWLTFVHSVAGEWLFGRSLGKALAGCEVVRVRRGEAVAAGVGEGTGAGDGSAAVIPAAVAEPRRPLLWQAMARNAVRWGMPPLALWVLADPGSQHPGDLLARTAVVVRRGPVREARKVGPRDGGRQGGESGEG